MLKKYEKKMTIKSNKLLSETIKKTTTLLFGKDKRDHGHVRFTRSS